MLDLPALRAVRPVLDLGELRCRSVLGVAGVLGSPVAGVDLEAELGRVLAAPGDRAERGKLATRALRLPVPVLAACSEAFHVTLEQINPVSRVSRIVVDGRLQPVALDPQPRDALPRLFEVERQCELDVLTLHVSFVRERHTDRRNVRL
jgi:hypothetical protein